MGITSSKDLRRVSFENTFALTPALNVKNTIKDNNIVELEDLPVVGGDELLFKDNDSVEVFEECDSDYWTHRLELLKREHQLINKINEAAYETTVENISKTCETLKISNDKTQKIRQCFDWSSKILKCYEDNPRQPLTCSSLVQAFSQCVNACRNEE